MADSLDCKVALALGWHIGISEDTKKPAIFDHNNVWHGDLDANMKDMPISEVIERIIGYGGTIPNYSTDLNAAWKLFKYPVYTQLYGDQITEYLTLPPQEAATKLCERYLESLASLKQHEEDNLA